MVLNNAFGDVYQKLDTSESSPVTQKSAAITSQTTFEQLVNISDEALSALIGENADNGCTYLLKSSKNAYFRNCLFYQKLALSDLPAIQIQLTKDTDPSKEDLRHRPKFARRISATMKGYTPAWSAKDPTTSVKLESLESQKHAFLKRNIV